MTYRVEIERRALKGLRRIDGRHRRRIEARIEDLANDPRPAGAIRLTGVDCYRISIGDYRVIYTISDHAVTVTVIHVGHRRSIYREV